MHRTTTVLATLAVVISLVLTTSAQYVPVSVGTVTANAGGSTITTFDMTTVGWTELIINLAPCAGLQIHTHNDTEFDIAAPTNANPLRMAYLTEDGTWVSADVKPGERFQNPTGLQHYQYNNFCTPAQILAFVPIGTNIQFTLPALAAIPAADFAVYSTNNAAVPVGNAPFGLSAGCQRTCAGGR